MSGKKQQCKVVEWLGLEKMNEQRRISAEEIDGKGGRHYKLQHFVTITMIYT